jgi:predicted nucleic acid-binding protein
MRRIYNRKFPHKLPAMERFLVLALPVLEVVPAPGTVIEAENAIRDVNDRPILRAAVSAKADILLTGDKDFLESGVTVPKIMTPAEFLQI